MPFSILTAKFTGSPDEAGWAQVYDFKPDDEEKLRVRGQLFAVISTAKKLEQTIAGVATGREILSRLHEEYFGKLEATSFVQLKKAVETVIEEFSAWEEVEIAAIAYLNEVSYLVAGGGAKIAILRGSKLTNLLQSKKGEVVSASGFPKQGDVLIAGTRAFSESFPHGVIAGALIGKSLSEAKDFFAPAIHSRPKGGNLGAILVKFERTTPEENSLENLGEVVSKLQQKPRPETPTLNKAALGQEGPKFLIKERFLAGVKKFGEKKVYVKEEGLTGDVSRKRKVSLSVGLLLLILLVVSIFFGVRTKRRAEFRTVYEEAVTSIEHELEEAEVLFGLNPERSRELLATARNKVLSLEAEGADDVQIQELKQRVEENQEKILGEYKVEPSPFIDLSLVSSGFKGDAVSLSQGKVYVVDREGRKIVAISVDSKRTEIVAGPSQISRLEKIAAYSDRVFFLNSDGVFEAEEGEKVIEPEWEGEVLMSLYAGNFYILDKGASAIYRYPGADNEFGQKGNWLSSGLEIDLSKASSLVIDGSIWVLVDSGEILKFGLGNPQPFRLSGVFPEIKNPSAIYTDEELKYLYVLEKEEGRVVVVSKEGGYKAQYLSDKIKEVTGLVVSEKEKKIILLTGEKLLSIDLENF